MAWSLSLRQIVCLAGLLFPLWIPATTWAQEEPQEPPIVGTLWKGPAPVIESVGQIMDRERRSTPKSYAVPEVRVRGRLPGISNNVPTTAPAPQEDTLPTPTRKLRIGSPNQPASQTTGTSFTAATYSDSGIVPPSSMGDVGPTQILIVLNGRIRTYLKTGALDTTAVNSSTDTFFSSVNNGSPTTDPRVVYDWLSQRWFVVMRNTAAASNRILIAVSNGPTISTQSTFTFYYFQHDLVSPAGDTGMVADFPTLGIDINSLYIGVNIYSSGTYQTSTAFVVNKASLLSGTLTVSVFRDLSLIFSPMGVTNRDPSAATGYFIGVNTGASLTIKLRRVTYSNGVPSISASSSSVQMNSVTIGNPLNVAAKGSASNAPLDALDYRLVNATMVNGALWTANSVQVDANGNTVTSGGRDAVRYYQISNPATAPAVTQTGLLYDSTASSLSYWIGSVATSGQGHTVIGSSYAGSSAYAGVAITGRLATDTVNTPPLNSPLTMPLSTTPGVGAYNLESNPPAGFQRWGDYSTVVVDPVDNMTMWAFQEYSSSSSSPGSWGVQVTKINAPPPVTPTSAVVALTGLSSAPAGTTVVVTVTGTSSGGSGFYDPGPGFTGRLSATVDGGGVTVNSITYSSPTSITLDVTIAASATAGTRTITVTNPDGQLITSSGIFTISTANAITLSPVYLANATANVVYSQNLTASGGNGNYTFSIAAGKLPTGLALSTSGAITGTPTTAGTETFSVQVTDNATPTPHTGSTEYTLNVASMVNSSLSVGLVRTTWNSSAPPGYVGQYTLTVSLRNTGSAISAPLYFQITTLSKTTGNPATPDKLLSADNGAGVVNDIQTLNLNSLPNATLANGATMLASLNVGIGERVPFTIFVNALSVPAGASMKSAIARDKQVFGSSVAAAPTPVLLGQFMFNGGEVLGTSSAFSGFASDDGLSNVGIITGPGVQSRPSVAVDPAVPTHMAIAGNDLAARNVVVSTSWDGGNTWQHATALSKTLGGQSFFSAQNPSVAFDSLGRLSVVYSLSSVSDATNALVISESSDGITFSPPAQITFHQASDHVIDDKPVLAIQANAGVYLAWESYSAATLSYSINIARSEVGGSFGSPVTVASGLVGSPVLALNAKSVYLGWDEWGFNSAPPYNTGGRLMLASSDSGPGLNFGTPQQIARTSIGFATRIPAMPDQGAKPGLSLAVDPKKDGWVYAVFTDQGNGLDIFLASSNNGGKKWQLATVNNDGTAADQFNPSITLDSDSNPVISFADTRLSGTFQTAHVYLARPLSGGSFDNERISTIASDDSILNPLRDYTSDLGDRTGVAVADTNLLLAWTDTRLGSEDIFGSVAFDADGHWVNGTGTTLLVPGAYPSDASITGKVTFGFDSRYKKGVSAPLGDTELSFGSGKSKFQFRSTSYDWLQVGSAAAQFAGSGKINGAGDYGFLLTAVDGSQTGGGGVDRFRIKIIDKSTGQIIFDNEPGAPDSIVNANPEPLADGNIQIH